MGDTYPTKGVRGWEIRTRQRQTHPRRSHGVGTLESGRVRDQDKNGRRRVDDGGEDVGEGTQVWWERGGMSVTRTNRG